MNATASAPGRGTGFFFSSSASNHWFVGILLLCVRFYAGYTIALTGFGKLPTWGESGFAEKVVGVGMFGEYAEILAFLAALAEFSGGILLAIGLFTRWSSFFLAVTLGFAAYVFNGAQPFLERDPAAMYSWLFLMFFAVGPGVLSLDALARHAATPKEDGRKGGGALWLMIFLIFAAAVGYPVALEYLNKEEPMTESSGAATSGDEEAGAPTEDAGASDSGESAPEGEGDASVEPGPSPEAGLEETVPPEANGADADASSPEAEAGTADALEHDGADDAHAETVEGDSAEAESHDELEAHDEAVEVGGAESDLETSDETGDDTSDDEPAPEEE